MKFIPTAIKDVYVIELEPREDERGYFMRTFCRNEFEGKGIAFEVAQASRSFSKKSGTIRGIHFQKSPKQEQKVVACLQGKIYGVVVDLRKASPTYRFWIAEGLAGGDKKSLYIPKGCGFGFQTLTDDVVVEYLMSEFYMPAYASGVRWDDPFFSIPWPIEHPTLSENDKTWPLWKPGSGL
jgi:dTDP-4-dehydrorhamnose 3,5-epimerase